MLRTRSFFSKSFCTGKGVEIGALHHPMPIPETSTVRYVDRLSTEQLRKEYPELNGRPLVDVDIIDDGESLASLPDGMEDFVIAAQFIEHCQNPVRALVNMLRVVRNNGHIMLTVPDKRFTFDKERPITTNEHLLDECMHGPEKNFRAHHEEFMRFTAKSKDEDEFKEQVDSLIKAKYSIHYHVWDSEAFVKFLFFTKERFQLPFEIQATFFNLEELIVILRKNLP